MKATSAFRATHKEQFAVPPSPRPYLSRATKTTAVATVSVHSLSTTREYLLLRAGSLLPDASRSICAYAVAWFCCHLLRETLFQSKENLPTHTHTHAHTHTKVRLQCLNSTKIFHVPGTVHLPLLPRIVIPSSVCPDFLFSLQPRA